MKIKRGEFLDQILKKVGISHRARPKSPYLTKRELLQLNSWLDLMIEKIKKHEQNS